MFHEPQSSWWALKLTGCDYTPSPMFLGTKSNCSKIDSEGLTTPTLTLRHLFFPCSANKFSIQWTHAGYFEDPLPPEGT